NRSPGSIQATAQGDINITQPLIAKGGRGSLEVQTTGGAIDIEAPVLFSGGGLVTAQAAGPIMLNSKIVLTSPSSGFAELDAQGSAVTIGSKAVLAGAIARGSTTSGTRYCLNASAGDLMLACKVLARGSVGGPGVIAGKATGNVTADGTFRVSSERLRRLP